MEREGVNALDTLVIGPISGYIFGRLRGRVGMEGVLPEEENDTDFAYTPLDQLENAVVNARSLNLSRRRLGDLLEEQLVNPDFVKGSAGRKAARQMIDEELTRLSAEFPRKGT